MKCWSGGCGNPHEYRLVSYRYIALCCKEHLDFWREWIVERESTLAAARRRAKKQASK